MHKQVIGWREWVSLPEFGIKKIKAKIDTGAHTSVLHAFQIDVFRAHGRDKVKFVIHPKQATTKKVLTCTANLVDIRWITDSSGNRDQRYVIETTLVAGEMSWPVEMTLNRRDDMRYRMLLGRTALRGRFLIDISSSYLLKKERILL